MIPQRGDVWRVRDESGALREFLVLGERPHMFLNDLRVTCTRGNKSKPVKLRLRFFTAEHGAKLLRRTKLPALRAHIETERVHVCRERLVLPRGVTRAELRRDAGRMAAKGLDVAEIARRMCVAEDVVRAVMAEATS